MSTEKPIFNGFDPNCVFQFCSSIEEEKSIVQRENETLENQRVDNHTLITLHKIYGNKWKQISNHLTNTSDSFIKNMFYTLARKALRKVNVYIELDTRAKGKKAKLFKLNFVFKLANLAESERIAESKQHSGMIRGFYTKLLYNLLDMGNLDTEGLKCRFKNETMHSEEDYLKKTLQTLVENLRIIEKIFIEQNLIKKGRTKKKFPKKGLVEKAYSSKVFKQSFEDLQANISLPQFFGHSKQHKLDYQITSESEGLDQVYQFEVVPENYEVSKNELDNFLEIKSFDPILFE